MCVFVRLGVCIAIINWTGILGNMEEMCSRVTQLLHTFYAFPTYEMLVFRDPCVINVIHTCYAIVIRRCNQMSIEGF